MDSTTAHALIRFGLGRRGNEAVPGPLVAWLAGQLDGPDPALALPGATTAQAIAARREDTRNPPPQGTPRRAAQLFTADAAALSRHVLETPLPFRERLVWFWANHFTISVRRGELRPLLIPYLREAIRPHVTGRFADMLNAVMHHPAMLGYLDNADSIGPGSVAGQRSHRGLNENLARECLELHTISPAAGYAQADVTAFAQVLTGWGVDLDRAEPGFVFLPQRQQPGPKTILGMTFPEGEAGGMAVLDWLGHHTATYRHIAMQLVRHFVADDPPPGDVARVAGALQRNSGDLRAASLELLQLPGAWQPLTKLRTPMDYVIAVLRALDLPPGRRPDLGGPLAVLGQPFMAAPLPNGWADTAAVWGDGELLLRRADWAMQVAGRAPEADPLAVADATLGGLLTPATRAAVHTAPTRREALALLLASPEFMRR